MHRLALVLATTLSLFSCTPAPATTPTTDRATTSPADVSPATEPAAPVAPPATADCDRDPFSTWPACESQPVRVRGTNPPHVMQHPLLAAPAFDGQPAEHQGYLDVPNVGQIIVLTREPIACAAAMVATGTLRRIEPTSSEPGVKRIDAYGGWVLEGATVECEGGTP